MRLLIYDTEMQTANGYLPKAIVTAAGKLLGASNVHLCGHEEIVENAASGAWDGLLAIGGAGAECSPVRSISPGSPGSMDRT